MLRKLRKRVNKINYHLIDDSLCELDEKIPTYENCEECPYFYECMEVEEEMDTYEEIMSKLNDLSSEELKKLSTTAEVIIKKRLMARKKELWREVVMAVKKYVEEFGDIGAEDTDYKGSIICSDRLDTPGIFYIDL